MRVHIVLRDELVRELDARFGPRRRGPFIARAVERALDDERRWELIESAVGAVRGGGHGWDGDAAAWVRDQRRGDSRRVG